MKALLITSDPYEPSGVIGLFETEEQKQIILQGLRDETRAHKLEWWKTVQWIQDLKPEEREKKMSDEINYEIRQLTEIEIPIGVYGQYYHGRDI